MAFPVSGIEASRICAVGCGPASRIVFPGIDIPHSALTLQSVVFFAFWSEQFDDLYGILVEVSDFLVFLAAEPY
ncbi:MAG: hypothetical protein QFX31_08315, partial [Methanothrix sp.]|uniref:hypothetical protein n=1 Tax=Methanothrix sp. TaxID=90426 RepID=UPI0032AFBD59|nr:hypothetical protein [Methanothrix sp.]